MKDRKHASKSMYLAFAGLLALGGALVWSCSSGGGGGGSLQPTNCTGTLAIIFSPSYSAYDGVHTFQVPAIVDGNIKGDIKWSASDPSMVGIQPDSTTGGIMITTLKPGDVTINAQIGQLCGSSVLHISAAQESDWEIGNARYNNGVALHFGRRGADGGMAAATDASVVGPACTNCHGVSATNGPFKDVSHTPEQTGGFSDQDLIDIVVNGVIPDGGYFDPMIISYDRWQSLHRWSDISTDQQLGMVVYLRSLTPVPQMGVSNFGGRHRWDGGMGMGPGGPPPDGGMGGAPPPDGGDRPDAGAGD